MSRPEPEWLAEKRAEPAIDALESWLNGPDRERDEAEERAVEVWRGCAA